MIKFKGLIAPTDVPTGDGRMFCSGKMTHRPLPLPLMAQFGSGGHNGATVVAKMESIYPGPGGYWAEGHWLDPTFAPEVPKAIYMVQQKVMGPSVDLDRDFTVQTVQHPSRPDKKAALFQEYNVIGATLVPMPAFYQVHMSVETPEEQTILASAGVDLSQFLTADEFAAAIGYEEYPGPITDAQFDGIWPTSAPLAIAPSAIDTMTSAPLLPFTAPGVMEQAAVAMAAGLQQLLETLTRLGLSVKNAHWNVTGPQFIAVHKMLDKMADSVRDQTDAVAERIATLGGSPCGVPLILETDAVNGRNPAMVYLAYLDGCFTKAILQSRALVTMTGQFDLITQDLLTGQVQELEKNQWFIRSHLC